MDFSVGSIKKFEREVTSLLQADTKTMGAVYEEWYEAIPDIEEFVDACIEKIHFSEVSKNIIRSAAKLASEESPNLFHGNKHFLQVFSLAFCLGNRLFSEGRIDEVTFRNLISAALIHDYKHDGSNNKGIQFRLEKIAVDSAESTLKGAGATDLDIQLIRAFVYTTDVSKDFSDPKTTSPAESLKWFSKFGDRSEVFDELQILIDLSTETLNLVDVALTLQDSDVGVAHLNYKVSNLSGEALAHERREEYSPNNQIFFMDKICHRRSFSHAGNSVIQPCLDRVMNDFGMKVQRQGCQP